MDIISVIVPFLNEEDCIIKFCEYIDRFAKNKPYKLEIVFVDDGSTDSSVAKLEEYSFIYCEKVKIIKLSKNFGVHSAIRSGLQNASGDFFVFVCADLQEPDGMIDVMYSNILSGYDVVNIEKNSVEQKLLDRTFSIIFSGLIRKFAVKNYGAGGICNIMFNRKIASFLNENVEANTSIVLQIVDIGFKSTTIKMDYGARYDGVSKWSFSKKIKLFIDSFVSFSFFPIRLVSLIGIIMSLIGFVYGIFLVISRLINTSFVAGYTTIISLLLIGFGITNISLGIIAEYLWRAYDAARNRPVFVISDIKDLK